MTRYILSLLFAATVVAQESTLEKFDALVIPIHQKSDELYVNIPEKTFGSDKNPSIYLNDMLFVKAIAELHGNTLIFVTPILIGLGLLCLVRRQRLKFEQEKKWEKEQKKHRFKDWRY